MPGPTGVPHLVQNLADESTAVPQLVHRIVFCTQKHIVFDYRKSVWSAAVAEEKMTIMHLVYGISKGRISKKSAGLRPAGSSKG